MGGGKFASARFDRHLLMAQAALDRLVAYRGSVRRAVEAAREATTDEARVAQLERAQHSMRGLRRDASAFPDVAAYLGLDAIGVEAIEAELAELHEPARTPE